MKDYENTFVRGPSPSYSDEGASAFSSIQANPPQLNLEQSGFDEKCASKLIGTRKQGRKTFAFWTVVMLLLILTIGNLILTLSIIGVLHLGKGIRGLELNSEEAIVKFFGSTDLDRVYMKGITQVDGFTDVPVSIEGEEGSSVHIRLQRNGQFYNRFTMDKSGVQLKSINNFEIKDPLNGNPIFTTHRPHFNMPEGAESLSVIRTISASRVSSALEKPLNIEGDNRMSIKGSEGIFIDGANIFAQAEHSISINGTQTMLEAGDGIFLDMDKIPIVSSEFGLRTGSVQYKLCVCMPQGILFRIPIPRVHNGPKTSCMTTHLSDPCAIN